MLGEHGLSGIGLVGCQRGFPECLECRGTNKVGEVRSPVVLECML